MNDLKAMFSLRALAFCSTSGENLLLQAGEAGSAPSSKVGQRKT